MTSGPPPSSGTFSVIPSTATASQSLSVSALLQQTRHAPRLLSHSVLDALFQLETDERDGLPQGHVLHVTGPPGAGKSRLCASLALNAPVDHSGMQVLIIGAFALCVLLIVISILKSCFIFLKDSSEGTLAPRELLKQAQHRFNNAGEYENSRASWLCSPKEESKSHSTELQQSLGNIHRLRLTSQTEFLAMIYGGLRSWLSNHPEVRWLVQYDPAYAAYEKYCQAKVIIIDSLSALLRASSFVNTESIQANPAPNRTGMPSSQLASSLPQGSKVNESKFTQRDHALSDLRDLIIQLTSGPNPYTVCLCAA